MIAWTGMHVVANLFPQMTEISSAALVEAMNTAGPIQFGPTGPFDWSTPAYSDGVLASLRIFAKSTLPMRVVDNKIVPIVKDFVPNDEPFEVSKAGKLSNAG